SYIKFCKSSTNYIVDSTL
ncbi:unnamed protein product, partial [Allacma fusca]